MATTPTSTRVSGRLGHLYVSVTYIPDGPSSFTVYEGVPKTASATGGSTSKSANKDFHSQSPTSSTSSDLNHGVQHDGRQTAAGTAGAAAAKKSS